MTNKYNNDELANSKHADVIRLLDINKKIAKLYRKAGKLEFRNGFVEEAGKNLIKAVELDPSTKRSYKFNGEKLYLQKVEEEIPVPNEFDEILDQIFGEKLNDHSEFLSTQSDFLNNIMENSRKRTVQKLQGEELAKKAYTAKDIDVPEYATLFAMPVQTGSQEDIIEFQIEDLLGDIENILGLLNKNASAKTEPVKAWNKLPTNDPWADFVKQLNVTGKLNHPVAPLTSTGEKIIDAKADRTATKKQIQGVADAIKANSNRFNKPQAVTKEVIDAMPNQKLASQLDTYMKIKNRKGSDEVTLEDIVNLLTGKY